MERMNRHTERFQTERFQKDGRETSFWREFPIRTDIPFRYFSIFKRFSLKFFVCTKFLECIRSFTVQNFLLSFWICGKIFFVEVETPETRVTRACKIPNGINYALQPIMKQIRDANNFEKSWRFVSNFNRMSLEEHRYISSEFRPLFFGHFGIKIIKA